MTTMIESLDNAEHCRFGQASEGWRLLERAALSVIQRTDPTRRSRISHYHSRARQLFYVLR
jgi:hypothetical protein